MRTNALFRKLEPDGDAVVVEYADLGPGERRRLRARAVFMAQGSTARLEGDPRFAYPGWSAGLITCFQYRVYPDRPAAPRRVSKRSRCITIARDRRAGR